MAAVASLAVLLGCGRADGTVTSFGPLRVGDSLPDIWGYSQKHVRITATEPPGRFRVHVVDDTLPPLCLDEECGPAGAAIASAGGHLVAGADGKLAMAFGVGPAPGNPRRFETSLVVVADDRGRVVAIRPGWRFEQAPDAARLAGY